MCFYSQVTSWFTDKSNMNKLNPTQLMALRLALRTDLVRLEGFVKNTKDPRVAHDYEVRRKTVSDLLESLAPRAMVTIERMEDWGS